MSQAINNTYAPSRVTGGTMYEDAAIKMMSPEDVILYVRTALGSIDAQMNDYKNIVAERQKKAEDLREAMAILRAAKEKNGDLKNIDPAEFARAMTLLSKYPDDPSVMKARDELLDSFDGFKATEKFTNEEGDTINVGDTVETKKALYETDADGNEVRTKVADRKLNKTEMDGVMDNIRSGLESLNSDNEMLMMGLQKLMQQRNQVSQFASNMLSSDNETKKSIIANMR